MEMLLQLMQDLQAWLNEAPSLVLWLALALLPLAGVPVAPLWIMAGVRWGPGWGMVGGVSAFLATVSLSHLLARRLMEPVLRCLLRKWWDRFPTLRESKGWMLILVCRMTPGLPFAVQNYLLPLAGVALPRNLLLTVLITTLQLAAFIFLGGALFEGRWEVVTGALVVLVLVGLLFKVLRRRINQIPVGGGVAPESDPLER